jgi:hypothetical protein
LHLVQLESSTSSSIFGEGSEIRPRVPDEDEVFFIHARTILNLVCNGKASEDWPFGLSGWLDGGAGSIVPGLFFARL